MEYKIAKKVIDKMVESAQGFDELLLEIKDNCPTEEFILYQKGLAQVMGYMLLDIINPIVKEHPDLKPPGLD